MFKLFPPMPPLPFMRPAGPPKDDDDDDAPVGVPVGTVLPFAGELSQQVTPLFAQGYLPCDGRQLAIGEYHELFLVIGYQYSASAGGGTFQLPDLQGYFLRGVDPAGKTDPDAQSRTRIDGATGPVVGSVQSSAFQLHQHDYSPASPSGVTAAGNTGTVGAGTTATSAVAQDPSAATPLTSKAETRPINAYVYFIIKYASRISRSLPPGVAGGVPDRLLGGGGG
ncbi:MAG TPA: phage tail protein [Kofleriaceae bacterium]|nr:phage tail protein [Kofleriaceae bacterium]